MEQQAESKQAPWKKVYVYDKWTGEFKHEYNAQLSPLGEGEYIEPICSTDVAPPPLLQNQAAVFVEGDWKVVTDFRGQAAYGPAGQSIMIEATGELADGWALAPPPPADDVLAAQARDQRNTLLLQSDWTQLQDSPMTAIQLTQWQKYRKSLRDLPQQAGFPHEYSWPDQPK